MNFEFQQNNDGSFAIYNNEIGDIYYSNIGAHNEAMQKFVIPADVTSLKSQKIKILDICYGMGYNSKTFVDYCVKNNYNFEFEIDCVELDKNILSLGLLTFDKNIDFDIHINFGQQILMQADFLDNMQNILQENNLKVFFKQLEKENSFKEDILSDSLVKKDKIIAFLHNIYYQNHEFFKKNTNFAKINLILGDLLGVLPGLSSGYDFIFHDAFSIRKQPELWSEKVFKDYYRLLNHNGKLLTYSNSRVVRRILENIGFNVKINYNENEKQNGTIAIKT